MSLVEFAQAVFCPVKGQKWAKKLDQGAPTKSLQKEVGQDPQVIITTPILEGTDGVEKMSKSYDNYIGLTDTPSEIYGRTLSIPDNLIPRYFEFATEIPNDELEEIKTDLDQGTSNPRDLKRRLARELVTMYHDSDAAISAEKEFDSMFIDKDEPDDMPEYQLSESEKLVSVMKVNEMVESNGEARRMIAQGGVRINKDKVEDIHTMLEPGQEMVIKVGKRKFLRIIR